jgi:uncharacterized membrane protein HdeD (DUF308 family)
MSPDAVVSAAHSRHRPNWWFRVEGTLVAIFGLVIVTVAWSNSPTSPMRIALLVASWGLAAGAVTLSIRRRSR